MGLEWNDDREGISFSVPELQEFWFSMDEVEPLVEIALNTAFRRLMPSMLDRALSRPFIGLPVPAFILPDELQPFGFRQGLRLGITEPQMDVGGSWLRFGGGFVQ